MGCTLVTFAQASGQVSESTIDSQLNSLRSFNQQISEITSEIKMLSRDFKTYESDFEKKADTIVFELIKLRHIVPFEFQQFALSNASFFTDSQKELVTKGLNSSLVPTDPLFLELVSRYNLTSFYNLIVSKLDTVPITNSVTQEIHSHIGISGRTKEQLRFQAALANLGADKYERELVELVNGSYEQISTADKYNEEEKINRLKHLYVDLIPHSIGKLNSIKSVYSTLHLLDENKKIKGSSDYGAMDFDYAYFMSVVAPKMKYIDAKYLKSSSTFSKYKGELKRFLLEGNDIWLNHLRN